MNVDNTIRYPQEKRIQALPGTLSITMSEAECHLAINALDLYSRIWIGQYERIQDLQIYDSGERWSRYSQVHMLFQRIRDLLIPSLVGHGDYRSCSLGIWSDKTDIRAINAYDIQQRLRYEISWFKNPEGDISVNYDRPLIKGNLGDYSIYCEQCKEEFFATLYLSSEQLAVIQTSLGVYRHLINRNMKDAFEFFTSNEEALSVVEELTRIYKACSFLAFSSDKNYGKQIYRKLLNATETLTNKIENTQDEKAFAEYIRVNISPANPCLPSEEILIILDWPFKHFRKYRRKYPPKDVLKLPGAGFLTKMSKREHSTTDYLLVWYDTESRTEYYYAGKEYTYKHGGSIDLPEDVRQFIREKRMTGRNPTPPQGD